MNAPVQPYRFLVCEAWSQTIQDVPLVGPTPPVLSLTSGTLLMVGVLCRFCKGRGKILHLSGYAFTCDMCHGQGIAAWGMVAADFVT